MGKSQLRKILKNLYSLLEEISSKDVSEYQMDNPKDGIIVQTKYVSISEVLEAILIIEEKLKN